MNALKRKTSPVRKLILAAAAATGLATATASPALADWDDWHHRGRWWDHPHGYVYAPYVYAPPMVAYPPPPAYVYAPPPPPVYYAPAPVAPSLNFVFPIHVR